MSTAAVPDPAEGKKNKIDELERHLGDLAPLVRRFYFTPCTFAPHLVYFVIVTHISPSLVFALPDREKTSSVP